MSSSVYEQERGHQVGQMRRVYQNAQRVIIWLGASDCEIDSLFDFMTSLDQQVLARSRPHAISTWEHAWWCSVQPGRTKQALRGLLQRDWFSRIWVLQEAALAKSAIVTCGWKEVNSRVFVMMPLLLNVEFGKGEQARLDILPGLLRAESWWAGNSSRDLLTLLQKFGRSKTSDDRDIVYALLGLSGDAHSSKILQPDYQISVREMIQRSVAYLMLQRHDLLMDTPIQSLPEWDIDEFLNSLQDLPFYIFRWAINHSKDALLYDLVVSQREKHNTKRLHQYMSCTGDHGPLITIAMKRKNFALIDLSVQMPGVDIETRDSKGHNPLSIARKKGNKIVENLIMECRQLDFQKRDHDFHTTLLIAAKQGTLALKQLLLQDPEFHYPARDFSGDRLLLTAAKQSDLAVVQWILNHTESDGFAKLMGRYRCESIIGSSRDLPDDYRLLSHLLQWFNKPVAQLTPFESALLGSFLEVMKKESAPDLSVKIKRFVFLRTIPGVEDCLEDGGWFGLKTPLGFAAQAGDLGTGGFPPGQRRRN